MKCTECLPDNTTMLQAQDIFHGIIFPHLESVHKIDQEAGSCSSMKYKVMTFIDLSVLNQTSYTLMPNRITVEKWYFSLTSIRYTV